jgi:uncharacterized protein YggE
MRVAFAWLLLAVVAPAWGTDLPPFPFINVSGHAVKAVTPDLAKVTLTVKARDPSAEVAARTAGDRAQQVLDLLAGAGIAPADIDAHEISKDVIFDRDSGFSSGGIRRGPPRYEVSRSFSVLLRRIAAWPELGPKLLEMPNVEDVGAQFDRTDREALEAELVVAAAHDAQQRAERIAAGFGQHLGAVQAVSQDPFEEISTRFLRADMRYAASAYAGSPVAEVMVTGARVTGAQVLVPATIELAQSVNAIYRLESAAR